VFGRVWRYCQGADGICKASQSRIAKDLRLERTTVNKHIKRLVKEGYLKDLTPDVKHKPHIYAETGKAQVRALIHAGVGVIEDPESRGVDLNDTSVEGVDLNNTPCGLDQHLVLTKTTPGVDLNNLKRVFKIDFKKEKDILSAVEKIKKTVFGEMPKAAYDRYVEPMITVGSNDHKIIILVPDVDRRDWCEHRLSTTFDRLAWGVLNDSEYRFSFVTLEDTST
jgi:DNA-binding Lrp family transcriptional regulator